MADLARRGLRLRAFLFVLLKTAPDTITEVCTLWLQAEEDNPEGQATTPQATSDTMAAIARFCQAWGAVVSPEPCTEEGAEAFKQLFMGEKGVPVPAWLRVMCTQVRHDAWWRDKESTFIKAMAYERLYAPVFGKPFRECRSASRCCRLLVALAPPEDCRGHGCLA